MVSSSSACTAATIALAGILSGCEAIRSSGSPTAPAAAASVSATPAATTVLTVRVLTRGSEQPVPAATVFRDNAPVGQTDSDGLLCADVPMGVEFSIDVTAPGFVGYGASATVNSRERWTFYLEPQS